MFFAIFFFIDKHKTKLDFLRLIYLQRKTVVHKIRTNITLLSAGRNANLVIVKVVNFIVCIIFYLNVPLPIEGVKTKNFPSFKKTRFYCMIKI